MKCSTSDAAGPGRHGAVDGGTSAQMVLRAKREEQELTDAQRTTRDTLGTRIENLEGAALKLKEDYYTNLESLLRKW